jgi:Domain of unknown function (DUF4157)
MTRQTATQTQQQIPTTSLLSRGGILQRKCSSCGQHTIAGGVCTQCQTQPITLQRSATNQSELSEVPPIVNEVLRSPGQPLDANTRAFMEPRFGHDFSRVRVRTDAVASESARVVGALAYTTGSNVVFAQGHYTPHTSPGRRLIAHELAHVIQQQHLHAVPAGISEPDSALEHQAEHAADRVTSGFTSPALPRANISLIAREQDTRTMPVKDSGVDEVVRDVTPGKCALVPESRASSTGGITSSKAFLQIDLCRGSVSGQISGELDYGEALQQAGQSVGKLLSNASSGQSSSQALSTFSNDLKQLKPGAQVKLNFLASDVFRLDITGLGEASAAGGASGKGTAKAEFDTGPVKLSVEGSVSGGTQEQTRYEITGNINFGGSKQRAPDCFVCECSDPKITFHCAHIPGKGNIPPAKPPARPQTRFIPYFFEYADITPNPRLVEMNQSNLHEAVNLLDNNYMIARIEGSASPEGPVQGKRGRFTNNTKLAEARAMEGKKQLDATIQQAMQSLLRIRTDHLSHALSAGYPVVGRGELFGANEKGEVKDEALLAHLQKTLESPAEGQPDPLAKEHVTGSGLSAAVLAETQADIGAFRTGRRGTKKLTKEQRLEAAYEPLRRALIVLDPPPPPPPNIRLSQAQIENIIGKPITCTDAHKALFANVPISHPFEGQCKAPGKQGAKP